MREIQITEREEGQRLDRFLAKYLPEASTGFLHKMLRKKNIKRNGKKAEGREKLECGDRIQIFFAEETLEKFSGKKTVAGGHFPKEGTAEKRPHLSKEQKVLRRQVRILYEDADIVVFHKPAGMLSQKASPKDDSLNDYLIDYCLESGKLSEETLRGFRPSVANRLDRNTSGIVLAGTSVRGLQTLAALLKDRKLGKYYLCLVKGCVKRDAHITGYLTKSEKNNLVTLTKEPIEGAAHIETAYQVLARTERVSLLKVHLITGKSHQIRSHLASIGHPIFGDYKYGDRDFNNEIKRQDGINYQLLHSYELIVPDDAGALAGMHIVDPVPEIFHKTQKRWGLDKDNGNVEYERS